MRIIKVWSDGRYTHHGIGNTTYDGYSGTADNRWSLKMATAYEKNKINIGETYQIEVNGINKGTFIK